MPLRPAPKGPVENLLYRRAILKRAVGDPAFQKECWIRASRDIVWWLDTFGWTYSPMVHADCPNRPFILWEYQVDFLERINRAVGKHDLVVDKSRDMGASWLCLADIAWRWQFKRSQSFLVGSRTEQYVDKSGDPKSLFWKLRFLIQQQPGWMQPSWDSIKLHLENLSNGSVIDGESTNDDFGRGDRRTIVLLDEFAAVENGFSILSGTRDTTRTRIFNSTSQGTATAQYDRKEWARKDPDNRLISVHWSLHPEKRLGLYRSHETSAKGVYKLEILDLTYKFPPGFPFVLDGKVRSPWYDLECGRAASKQEIAQELDMEDQAAGWQFFDPEVLKRLIRDFAQPPLERGELTFEEFGRKSKFIPQAKGRLQLWIATDDRGRIPPGQYSLGADIATGKGGEMSSNSVASIVNRMTGEKVAQFTTNQLSPEDFCDYCLALARWFHNALLIHEENGPGGQFTKQLINSDYRYIFYREDESSIIGKKSRKVGWHSGKDSKKALLGSYFRAMLDGKFTNRCEEALKECGEYVHDPNGTIVHAKAKNTIDPTAAGENHGDMVIADALANRGMEDVPRQDVEQDSHVPENSFLGRRMAAQRERQQAAYW